MGELSSLLFEFAGIPGIVGLHNGLPPSDAFPVESLTIKLQDGAIIEIDDPAEVRSWRLGTLECSSSTHG